ncbi:MAG TPA: helix-turn-helix transcriptional regulator [Phenylobacterium sp.]|jgi:hypothetical protein
MDLVGASSLTPLEAEAAVADCAPSAPLRTLRMSPSSTLQVQVAIGLAMRRRRRLVDMTLRELADACEVSFQQIHKYEAGQCGISAVQLWRIGSALGVPVSYFFERLKALDLA